MRAMRAWAYGLRTSAAYTTPGMLMSSRYCARPVTFASPSARGADWPTSRRLTELSEILPEVDRVVPRDLRELEPLGPRQRLRRVDPDLGDVVVDVLDRVELVALRPRDHEDVAIALHARGQREL